MNYQNKTLKMDEMLTRSAISEKPKIGKDSTVITAYHLDDEILLFAKNTELLLNDEDGKLIKKRLNV